MGEVSPLNMRLASQFVIENTQHTSLNPLRCEKPTAPYIREYSRLLSSWSHIASTGRGGSYLDICLPGDENGKNYPSALKILNQFSPQFLGTKERVDKWKDESEMQTQHDFLIPRGISLSPQVESAAKAVLFEREKYEELFSPYILPAELVIFVPKVDVVEPIPSGIMREKERQLRGEAGMLTADGRRFILKKGVPAIALVEDFIQKRDQITGSRPLDMSIREQLKDLISKLIAGFERGLYPDPGIIHPENGNLVIANDDQLILIDTNFLVSAGESFAKKDFNRILDALYYYARDN